MVWCGAKGSCGESRFKPKQERSNEMNTTIHQYRYNLGNPTEAKQYADLCTRMEAQGIKCFEAWGRGSFYNPALHGVVIELETKHLFDNQWNTAPIPGISDKGLRVFDWAQDCLDNKRIKMGHWLEQTPEMIEVRANRRKCGYCGKQYDLRDDGGAPKFCQECLWSQFLKREDLYLVRVVELGARKFPKLTSEELAELLPLYEAEQAGKGSERSKQARERIGQRIEEEYKSAKQKAETKYGAMRWLFERGASVRLMENTIYYKHKDVFTFGWQDKLEEGADLDWLMREMSEFPYRYNIKTKHRGKIGGVE